MIKLRRIKFVELWNFDTIDFRNGEKPGQILNNNFRKKNENKTTVRHNNRIYLEETTSRIENDLRNFHTNVDTQADEPVTQDNLDDDEQYHLNEEDINDIRIVLPLEYDNDIRYTILMTNNRKRNSYSYQSTD